MPNTTPFRIYRSNQPHVADEIRHNPSLWAEILLPDGNNRVRSACGTDIELPILGDEYRIEFWYNDYGEACFVDFLWNLRKHADLRVFFCEDKQETYIYTNADGITLSSVLVSTMQEFMQEFGIEAYADASLVTKQFKGD